MENLIRIFEPIVYVAIFLLAIIAARRLKLIGLWLLVLAALLTALQSILSIVLSSLLQSGHDNVKAFQERLQHVPFVIALIALFGFCALALGSKPEGKTNP
jgi:cobalamin synthase